MNNKEINWIIGGVMVLVIFLFGSFSMRPHMDYGRFGSYWTGGYGFMWAFMALIWVLIIIALILGIFWLVRQLQRPKRRRK